jgi:hypothetical protein
MIHENTSQTHSQANPEEIDTSNIQWTKEIDLLLAGLCDNAKCYEWMHITTSDEYNNKAKKFMIAVNVLTAISGVSNIMAGGYQINGFQISWLFGTISVLTSTLNIIQNKLAYQTLAESHKKSAQQWRRIISKIEEVIILPPTTRTACKPFMKYIRNDINHATLDGDTLIPTHIRELCFEKFKNVPNFNIPDVCGQVEHTTVYIYPKNEDISIPLLSPKSSTYKNKKVIKSFINVKEYKPNTSSEESTGYIPASPIPNINVPNNINEQKLPQSPVPS